MIPQALISLFILFSLLFGSVKLISLGHTDSQFMKRSAIETTKILRKEKSYYCSSTKTSMLKIVCSEPHKKIQMQFKTNEK